MLADCVATVVTEPILGPASTAPVVELKAITVPTLDALSGNSIDAEASESCNLIDLPIVSSTSASIATNLSSSVFREEILKAP